MFPLNGLALCAGYGGLELGVKRAIGDSYRTVGYVEREASAASVLVARMADKALDPAPVWDDLSTFDGTAWRGCVDLVTAGFPCQPFSTASRGRKRAVDLWPEVLRVVREILPGWGLFENVARAPIDSAARDLGELGYRAKGGLFCPSEMGSAMRRPRWFLLAHRHDADEPGIPLDAKVASACIAGPAEWREAPERGLLGVDDGSPGRVDRLRMLGNGVVPVCAARALCELWERLKT